MPSGSDPPLRLGVLGDTHIPDRIKRLPAALLSQLREARVDRILHTGDVSSVRVIETLRDIAPVSVVQGNRDWFFQLKVPTSLTLEIHGLRLILTHGHLSMHHYLLDKFAALIVGYRFERYQRALSRAFPEANMILFGHTHRQVARRVGEQFFFNPGAVYPCRENNFTPEFGLVTIQPNGAIQTRFCQIK